MWKNLLRQLHHEEDFDFYWFLYLYRKQLVWSGLIWWRWRCKDFVRLLTSINFCIFTGSCWWPDGDGDEDAKISFVVPIILCMCCFIWGGIMVSPWGHEFWIFFWPFFFFWFLFTSWHFFCHIHTLLPFEIWPLFQFI